MQNTSVINVDEGYQILISKPIKEQQEDFAIVYECLFPDENLDSKPQLTAKLIEEKDVSENLAKREVEILEKLQSENNPNLVKVYKICKCKFPNQNDDYIAIISEKCPDDLRNQIETRVNNQQWFKIKEVIIIISQIVKGYKSLYAQNIIHRNIQPANFLIKNNLIKISNFAFGRVVEDMKEKFKITRVGTPKFACPQIYFGEQFSAKADVFSLGVLFYQLLYCAVPIKGKTQGEILKFYRQFNENSINFSQINPYNETIPDDIILLLKSMLTIKEEDRIDWESLFNHPILNNLDDYSLTNSFKKETNLNQNLSNELQNEKQEKEQQQIKQETVGQQQIDPSIQKSSNQQQNIQVIKAKSKKQNETLFNIKTIFNVNQKFQDSCFINPEEGSQSSIKLTKTQRISQMIKFIEAKGDVAILLGQYLESYYKKFNLNEFQQCCLNLSLLGYKFTLCLHAYAFTTANHLYLSKSHLEKLNLQALTEYANDKSENIQKQKQDVIEQYSSTKESFEITKNQLLFYQKMIDYEPYLVNLYAQVQKSYEIEQNFYLQWYRFFYNRFFPLELMYDQDLQKQNSEYLNLLYLLEKFYYFEEEYPLSKYQSISLEDLFIPSNPNFNIIAEIQKYRKRLK